MIAWLQKLAHVLQLTRVERVLAAVSNSWLIVFLAYAVEPNDLTNAVFDWMPLWLALLLAALVSAGLSAHGLALNDLLDARHDLTFRPKRPIAAGRIGRPAAVVAAVGSLLVALSAAVVLGTGSALLGLVIAAAILFYNTAARFLPAVGIMLVGLIHLLNMFVPNPELGFAWPIWLTLTHVTACHAIGYMIEGKRPQLQSSDWWGLCAGWAFWTLALVGWMLWRQSLFVHGRQAMWLGPIIVAPLFVIVAWWLLTGGSKSPSSAIGRRLHRTTRLRSRRSAGTTFTRLAMLWLIVYDASWLLAGGLLWQGLVLISLLIAALGTMWAIRTLTQTSGDRPTYRVQGPSIAT